MSETFAWTEKYSVQVAVQAKRYELIDGQRV